MALIKCFGDIDVMAGKLYSLNPGGTATASALGSSNSLAISGSLTQNPWAWLFEVGSYTSMSLQKPLANPTYAFFIANDGTVSAANWDSAGTFTQSLTGVKTVVITARSSGDTTETLTLA